MAYDQYGNYIPDQSGQGGQSALGSALTGYNTGGAQQAQDPYNYLSSGYPSDYSQPVQSGITSGLGSQNFNIPSGQQGQGQQFSPYGGYSQTGQGLYNYMQGTGPISQVPSSQMPTGLPSMAAGTYNPQYASYLQQGGLNQQQYGLSQSGIAQGIQNVLGLANTMGVPTGMAGAQQIASLAAGGQANQAQQQMQDTLSAAQGQRGTGAGLGSNTDQMLGTALGTVQGNVRNNYSNLLAQILQSQFGQVISGAKSLSPTA